MGRSIHCSPCRQKDTSTFRVHASSPNLIQRGGFGKTLVWSACGLRQDRKGNTTQVLTHPLFVWRISNSLLARLAASSNELPFRSLETPLLSSSTAFRSPCQSLRDAGCGRNEVGCLDGAPSCYFAEPWDHDHLVFVASCTSTTLQLGTHTLVEYALHSWFISSDVATHETTQTAVGGAGKRMLQRASRYYAWMEYLGRWECDAKKGMAITSSYLNVQRIALYQSELQVERWGLS